MDRGPIEESVITNIEIKRASNSDAHILTDLGRATFIETFAKDNHKSDMDQYIAETFGIEKQNDGYQTIWLGVWEKNFRAQSFYKKYNFLVVDQHNFRLGTDDQIDLIMSRNN